MRRDRARSGPAWLCALAAVLVTVGGPTPAGAAPAGFDSDPVYISGSGARFSGEIEWDRSGERTVSATLSGTLSAEDGCARVRVDWLNSGTRLLKSRSKSTCDSRSVTLSSSSASLACARIRLFVDGSQTGAPRLVCAGD
jgi:hypothetical protein